MNSKFKIQDSRLIGSMLHAFCVLCCVAAIVAGLFYGMIAEVELHALKADRGQWNMILSDRALAERAAEKDNSRFKIQNLKFKTSKNLESAPQVSAYHDIQNTNDDPPPLLLQRTGIRPHNKEE